MSWLLVPGHCHCPALLKWKCDGFIFRFGIAGSRIKRQRSGIFSVPSAAHIHTSVCVCSNIKGRAAIRRLCVSCLCVRCVFTIIPQSNRDTTDYRDWIELGWMSQDTKWQWTSVTIFILRLVVVFGPVLKLISWYLRARGWYRSSTGHAAATAARVGGACVIG